MKLSALPSVTTKPKRRVGRGYGSGRAKTAGRGTKGQKARSRVRRGFEGGQNPLIHRMPYLRGKGRNKSQKEVSVPVSLGALDVLSKGTKVTLAVLKEKGIVAESATRVKILVSGTLKKALHVHVPCSLAAKKAIEKAGGTVVSANE